ncbi:hypothetical protein B4092_0767 [Bacillus licheniformis]|nr:hypothetical protein B4092_0767 [Bacillus licheniformis]TWJ69226.1 hypothetical protein CHCC5020_0046 [Bacillus licheniformis]TWN47869.1 hypothetical protein CHCC14441_2945 [Bacillus licheniformis]TWN64434.1 hypothetical protein CHCC14437_4372 [Bacillus licheniformis]TWO10999.1 hypothetical protein CHCC20486_3897 [Bacillus licheniformis]
MSKAKRLNEMITMVNRKKRFTVGELAREFGFKGFARAQRNGGAPLF